MKKTLIMTAVAALAVGSLANAAVEGGKEGKPEAVRAKEVNDAAKKAGEAAQHGADSSTTNAALMKSVKSAGLDTNLNPNESHQLGINMSKAPAIAAAVKSAVEQSKNAATRDLAAARIRGLALVGDIKTDALAEAVATMNPDAQIEQAYVALLLNAGEQAANWTPETRDNLTALLSEANALRASGKSVVDAMKEANASIAKPKEQGGRGVKLKFEDVNKFCKGKKA